MKKIILYILLVTSVAYASQEIYYDTLKFGKVGSTANKLFQLGDDSVDHGAIRFNYVDKSLEFSADNKASWKKIGSGSGGGTGTNILVSKNSDFESNLDDWSSSGGAFSLDILTPLFGSGSGQWDSGSLGETVGTGLEPITAGFIGRRCQAEIYYRYPVGASGDISLVVSQHTALLSSESDIASIDLEFTGSDTRTSILFFDCPSDAADTLRLSVKSNVADAGILTIDQVFLGTGRNVFGVSTAGFYASIKWPATSSCQWSVDANSTSYVDFPADSDCPTPTVLGAAGAPATKVPQINFAILKKGKYQVHVEGGFYKNGLSDNGGVGFRVIDDVGQIIDDNQVTLTTGTGSFSAAYSDHSMFGILDVPSDRSNAYLKIQSTDNGLATTKADILNSSQSLKISLIKIGDALSEAVTMETSGWVMEANIYSTISGDVTLNNSNISSYTAFGDASLQIEKGARSTVEVEIPCASGTAPTGTTCSGVDESVGIAFQIPTKGTYQICTQFPYYADYGSGGNFHNVSFQLIETGLADTNIIQLGGGIANIYRNITSSQQTTPVNLCGLFNFDSTGRKVIRVMREQNSFGAVVSHRILVDRSASTGQRDLHFYGYKLNQGFPTPIFTDLTTAINTKIGNGGSTQNVQVVSAYITNSGSPVVTRFTGESWISSLTDSGTGITLVNFSTNFSEEPQCFCQISDIENRVCQTDSEGIGSVSIRVRVASSTSNFIDENFSLLCIGKR